MTLPSLAWPALAVLLSIITYLTLNRAEKNAVLRRFGLRRGPARPNTPSLEKQPTSSKPLASSTSELTATFPPSQREQLRVMREDMPLAQQKALGDLSFDRTAFERSLLGFEEDYNKADDSKYIYSGFAVREIKALGDFPDDAAISEVPLPRSYEGFDIDKAKPRPYRPFRWAYHQTMCKGTLIFRYCLLKHGEDMKSIADAAHYMQL